MDIGSKPNEFIGEITFLTFSSSMLAQDGGPSSMWGSSSCSRSSLMASTPVFGGGLNKFKESMS